MAWQEGALISRVHCGMGSPHLPIGQEAGLDVALTGQWLCWGRKRKSDSGGNLRQDGQTAAGRLPPPAASVSAESAVVHLMYPLN